MGRQRKVKPEEAVDHEVRAWALRQRGWTQERIAAELGLTQQAISHILKRVSQRYLREITEDVARVKAEQDAVLNHVVAEAIAAWERSKAPTRTVTTRRTEAGGATTEHTIQQAVEQTGEAAYLDRAMAALADIRRIWGAEAPAKLEHSGEVATVRRYVGIDPDEV